MCWPSAAVRRGAGSGGPTLKDSLVSSSDLGRRRPALGAFADYFLKMMMC
jgi:hypothetical protein